MSVSSDLQLLVTALQTNGEAEADGVKFIYMDDSTVYRFENNRMKKVSQTMLKKANKLLAQQNAIAPASEPSTPKRQRKTKQQQPAPPPPADDEEEEDAEESQPAPPPPPAPKRQRKPKQQPAPQPAMSSNIDLNEYWQVKNRNEYMNSEIERLNHKVSKLKQYKNIVTRLTGGEYDVDVPQQLQPQQQQQQQQQPQYQQRAVNDSLFMF